MSSLTYAYCILLIIRGEKVLLFHIFTFIPKKLSWLPVFTSFHSIHMQKLAKKFHGCEVIHEKYETFLPQIIINIQCDPYEHNVLVLLVSKGMISSVPPMTIPPPSPPDIGIQLECFVSYAHTPNEFYIQLVCIYTCCL